MRIAIDLQGLQSDGSRVRGIGRYSIEIIKNIIHNNNFHDYILVANAAMKDLRLNFKDELQLDNVIYYEWCSPCPVDFLSGNITKSKTAIYLRSYSFFCIHADVILITSFFEGFNDNCLVEFDESILNTKIVSIFYDLIPLLNPSLYLDNNPEFHKFYNTKIENFKQLDGILAISKSSANEAIKFLGFEERRVFNISSACNRDLFNVSQNETVSHSIDLEDLSSFILYAGAFDLRKNIYNLLAAYSILPNNILEKYKLVLAGKIANSEKELIDIWIRNHNIDSSNVLITGYISDEDLKLLYRSCSLFIFPSLHEGFGLPVLEAMCCGAPVIGSNSTSIPEIIQIESAMFDPINIESIKQLIEKSLLDLKFRDKLSENSFIQSSKFSWSKSAEAALIALEEIVQPQCINYTLSWDSIQALNEEKFKLLISKIQSSLSIFSFKQEELICQISACLDKINTQACELARSIKANDPINSWTIEGPIDSTYSLAILNRNFADSMSRVLSNLYIHITEGPGDYEPNISFLKRYSNIYSIYKKSIDKKEITEVVSRNLYPPRVRDLSSKFNILHSYGWEESEFPSQWVDEFNTYLQGITVMSTFVKKILIDNGVNIPINVSRLGLDHVDKIDINSNFNIEAKSYKILHISSCFPRKGIDILLKAYGETFTNNDDITLIIKTFDNPHNDIEDIINGFRRSNPLFPHILLIKEDLSDQQLKSILLQSDLLVSPSRGEGFGLPIGEAMRLGKPVITTNWGGQVDFCSEDNCWLLDYEFVRSSSHFGTDFSYWAEPSFKHLSFLLRHVYDMESSQLKEKVDSGFIKTKEFIWSNVAKQNIDFVNNKLTRYNNRYFKLGCVTTLNTHCGIASYSKYLLEHIKEEIIFFTPVDENSNNKNTIPSWGPNTPFNDLTLLLEKVLASDITSLLIQFNYGFYDFNYLSNLICKLKKNNVNILIVFHSTIDPENKENKKLSLLSDSLSICDRLIVHSIADLNRLKKLGLINNVCLLPHGIINIYPPKKYIRNYFRGLFKNYSMRIASYGFCLPSKGFKELILSIDILRRRGFNIKLFLYTAIYNQEFAYFYDELIDLISSLNLQEHINISREYTSDTNTINNLSRHDCLVFPYQNSNESSSAAVRHGLASLKPVLVTPSPIFDNVSNLVYYLKGFSPIEIADSLEYNLYSKNNIYEDYNKSKLSKYQLIENRRFSKVSKRLLNIIKSLEIN